MKLPLIFNLTLAGLSACQIRAEEKPMNVMFICIDDMNDWIEPLGGSDQVKTPNLTKLAQQGMLFTNAHTSSAACHPSRVSLWTGVQPASSGVMTNVFAKGECTWRKVPMLNNTTTMSQHFRNNGYKAICGGKIFHTLQGNPSDENDYSNWDLIMPGDSISGSPIAFQPRAKKKNVDFNTEVGLCPNRIMSWAPMEEEDREMADHKLVDWSIEQLNKDYDQPFFMAVGIFRPHLPWEVPQRYFDMYPLEDIKIPDTDVENEMADCADHGRRHWHRWVKDNDIWKTGVQGYLASISFTDYQVGRLMEALEKSGKAENTIVVFWSDHGMHIGEKENWEKFTCFAEATRIPIMVIDPRHKPGKSNVPVASVDLFPTLVELTNTETDENTNIQGESVASVVKGLGTNKKSCISSYQKTHAVISENYRYIYSEKEKIEELYDLKTDPEEHTNIAYFKNMRGVVEQKRELLTQYTGLEAPTGFNIPKGFTQLKDETIRRNDYRDISEIPYKIPKWWKPEVKEKARKRMRSRGTPFVDQE